jgi:hypothetical protein
MLGYLAPKGVGFGQNGAISETLDSDKIKI